MKLKSFRSPDGVWWGVNVKAPSHSNAMVVFLHPDGTVSRKDRYAWFNSSAAGASDPRSHLDPAGVLERLDESTLARLFRRSMPVHVDRPSYIAS